MGSNIKINKYLENFFIDEKSKYIYKTLLRKYELSKKLYLEYDENFKNIDHSKELNIEQYKSMIICFMLLAVIEKDIRYYNTALKIADKTQCKIPLLNIMENHEQL